MCMMNNKVDFDMDMAVEALMAIIEREQKAELQKMHITLGTIK